MLLNCGAGEDSWESLGCKIKPVHPKGNQAWIFIGRTDAEAETTILWPPDAKSWLIWKDPDAGKDWRQEEKGTTEDEMVGWHHGLNEHEFASVLVAEAHIQYTLLHIFLQWFFWTECFKPCFIQYSLLSQRMCRFLSQGTEAGLVRILAMCPWANNFPEPWFPWEL